jgi:3-hydroxybutyryl-CoA dehydrogenase
MSTRISVIGMGTMGVGIAQILIASGYEVMWLGHNKNSVEAGLAGIDASLHKAVKKGMMTEQKMTDAKGMLSTTTEYKDIEGSEAIIEAVKESVDVKIDVLRSADRHRGHSIIATNTSSISITRLSEALEDKGAFLGMHFFNPAPVMKLVELVVTEHTSEEAEGRARSIANACGKTAVRVNDYPGFIANNILIPMLYEAAILLERNVAEKEGIDTIARLGLNHPMGPFELADFIGLDVCKEMADSIYDATKDERFKTPDSIKGMVAAGKLGRKTGEGFYIYKEGRQGA